MFLLDMAVLIMSSNFPGEVFDSQMRRRMDRRVRSERSFCVFELLWRFILTLLLSYRTGADVVLDWCGFCWTLTRLRLSVCFCLFRASSRVSLHPGIQPRKTRTAWRTATGTSLHVCISQCSSSCDVLLPFDWCICHKILQNSCFSWLYRCLCQISF